MKKYFLYAMFSLFLSCENKSDPDRTKIADTIKPSERKILENFRNRSDTIKDYENNRLKDCINRTDTIFDKKHSLQYIILDSFFAVKLKIGGMDTILDYRFNCSVPRGLIPKLFGYYDHVIYLIRGSGQHYREIVISYINHNNIIIKSYETGLTADFKKKLVVYQSISDFEKIVVEDVKSGRRKQFLIPSKYRDKIIDASLTNDALKLSFSDGAILRFKLS